MKTPQNAIIDLMINLSEIPTIAFSELEPQATEHVLFDGHDITITSAPSGSRIDVTNFVRDPLDFHGPTDVDHVINFGGSLSGLIGTYDGPSVETINGLPDSCVEVLSETNINAVEVVRGIDNLARQLIADSSLYDNKEFCRTYYDLAEKGYRLLDELDDANDVRGIPVSLIRAGLVTTRLAHGFGMDEIVPEEVQVETKRFHPKGGQHTDISVTVRWADYSDPLSLQNKAIEIADFVNPASWASTAALLIALKQGYGVQPTSVMHRSFMGTEQGVALAKRVCSAMNIKALFKLVGIADRLNDMYYLSGDIAVGDAGQALRHFRPGTKK